MFAGENWFTRVRKKLNQPQIIKTDLIAGSYSFWPFTILGRNRKSTDQAALIAHEQEHFKQQRGKDMGLWLLRYAFSDSYRWRMERAAIEKQIRDMQSRGIYPNYNEFIDYYANNYDGMASKEEIAKFIYHLRDTNPYSTFRR